MIYFLYRPTESIRIMGIEEQKGQAFDAINQNATDFGEAEAMPQKVGGPRSLVLPVESVEGSSKGFPYKLL